MSSMPTVNLGGAVIIPEANNTPLILTAPAGSTTTGLTFHTAAGTNYQVPVDTKFVILGVFINYQSTTKTITVFQSDAADGTTGEVDKFVFFAINDQTDDYIPVLDFPSVAASKFVNYKTSEATNSPTPTIVIGYEVAV